MLPFPSTLLSALLIAAVASAAYSPDTEYTDIAQAFPQFADARERRPYPPIGQQNFTWCCIRALYESFTIDPTTRHVIWATTPYIRVENALELSTSKWPCGGASYEEDDRAAPIVEVPYSWCTDNCGGWQKSVNSDLSQWIQPFIGFILPAAVFCLSVPRKRSFMISDELFQHDLIRGLRERWKKVVTSLHYWTEASSSTKREPKSGLVNYLLNIFGNIATFIGRALQLVTNMAFRAGTAAAIAFLNTVVWVAIVFAMAAPIVFSALYEAKIDRQVLKTIRRTVGPIKDDSDPHEWLRERREQKKIVQLLYAVLLGNMLMEEDEAAIATAADEESIKPPSDGGSTTSIQPTVYKMYEAVEKLVEPFGRETPPDLYTLEVTRNRLRSLLMTQFSFGVTIGAPIVFYLGSFLVSIFDNAESWGDNNTSHALAFGEWWMTVPHVAIMSGCLLAANNPNTFESIMSGLSDRAEGAETNTSLGRWGWIKHKIGWWSDFNRSPYQPVWMWERGRNKKKWMKHITRQAVAPSVATEPVHMFRRSETTASVTTLGGSFTFSISRVIGDENEKYTWKLRFNRSTYNLRAPEWFVELIDPKSMLNAGRKVDNNLRLPDVDLIDWAFIIVIGSALIFIPFVLAYLTSYNTPTVGLSCRSFTYVLYFLFQLWLSFLWLWDFRRPNSHPLFKDTKWAAPWNKRPTIFGLAVVFGILGALFTAIVGTFLQILGVYRNCLCKIPMSHWSKHDALVVLSTNSAESIQLAMYYWMSTGIAAVVLLLVVAYSGWWYQRHWRAEFRSIVDEVFKDPARLSPLSSLPPVVGTDGEKDTSAAKSRAVATVESEAEVVAEKSDEKGSGKAELKNPEADKRDDVGQTQNEMEGSVEDVDAITPAPK